MQYESLDDRTRTALVNIINAMFHVIFKRDFQGTERNQFWRNILRDVYSQQIDCNPDISYKTNRMFEIINNTIYEEDYASVLSIIEYIARLFHKKAHYPGQFEVYDIFNDVLETEFVGYRFVNGYIVQITSDIEISQIEEAAKSKENKVDEHINKALNLLADHEPPDYENSIKESISAVEAMAMRY